MGHEIINLGGSSPIRIRTVIELIEKAVGARARIEVLERPSVDVDSTWADISRARRLLHWQPESPLPLQRPNLRWYKHHGEVRAEMEDRGDTR